MKNGPLIFLGGLIALVTSWGCLVLAPVVQLGALTPHTDQNTGITYPVDRPGAAKQGAEVYRALGCAECHTRFATQDSLWFGARITGISTNTENKQALVQVLKSIRHDWTDKEASDAMGGEIPIQILANGPLIPADRAIKLIEGTDSKVELTVHNNGQDLERGWGKRLSVSRDYINDEHALLGSLRIGPDLANIGSRGPDAFAGKWSFTASETNAPARLEERRQWHLVHLYNPRIKLPASTMPGYKFLFDEVGANDSRTADALPLPEKFAPGEGRSIVPTAAANALVAWLLNQQADISLPEAPVQKPYEAPKPKTPTTGAEGAEQ
jgi:cbb3-type cytochrome oxidase cytochrome c subunit